MSSFWGLRFSDPKIESLYYNYYAQVKRNLLPTAIKVVLLVNVLQLLASGIHFYLLEYESPQHQQHQFNPHPNQRSHPHQTHSHLHQNNNNNNNNNNGLQHHQHQPTPSMANQSVLLFKTTFVVQIVIAVLTFAMLRVVRAELDPRHQKEARHARRRLSGSGQSRTGAAGEATNSETREPIGEDKSNDDSRQQQQQLKRKRRGQRKGRRRQDDLVQRCSDPTAGLSLTIEMDVVGGQQNHRLSSLESGLEKQYSSSSDSDSDSDSELADGQQHEQLGHPRGSKIRRRRRKRSGKFWAAWLGGSSLKLSLPYLLWLCQIIQLSSGLTPQQSFISYSTLLLYSYTIYVIFPIRLLNCILLASGLLLSQPIVDHLLLNSLRSSTNSLTTATISETPTNSLQHNGIDSSQLNSHHHHHRPDDPSTAINSSSIAGLTSDNLQQTAATATATTTSGTTTIQSQNNLLAANEMQGNWLLVPMSSHLLKLVSFMMIVIGVNIIGIMSFLFYERQQRVAYLETRQSLDTKLILEQESQEQERLLLSILPKHLAAEIRQDLGAVVTGQFKKIYMSRHENVSILFADIVGFTAISSHCPAAELVKTLNELFASFDKLAEKYHQLRIKILGDCYYAISGAPEERPDHAVLCVHMGLSMVEAIKSVRERTKSTVDMRVGVHTGGVLAGVLGQRQWQFDVYSKDVELANKMESSGMPGRVHISNKTLRFLNDEFEVSDGDGASREEALRLANIKTYFIERVKKPYPEGTLDAPDRQREQIKSSPQQPAKVKEEKRRQDSFNLDNQIKQFSLNFANGHFERQFRSTSDIASCISLVGLPITLLSSLIAYLNLYGGQPQLTIIAYLSSILLLLLAVSICVLPYLWCQPKLVGEQQQPLARPFRQAALSRWLMRIAETVKHSASMKLALTALMTSVWLAAHFVGCRETSLHLEELTKIEPLRLFSADLFNYFAVACSLAITAVTRISFLVKTLIIITVILMQVLMNITFMSELLARRLSFGNYPSGAIMMEPPDGSWQRHYDVYIFTLTLATVCWALLLINRQFELTNRRLFLWRKQVEERKEKVADMREKNEALVYNILPPNVARIFLGKRTINDEELYSKSYDAVGVLFAAMPNFSDFYTEESVNNQGLECLRFLNEVISDYDALLDQDRFKNIIKIKTMGPTYMAASGLYEGDALEEQNAKPAEGLAKWAHLVQLTEFALALKDTLNNINKESFNNFVLRIGINQGPITAGVIGVKKPHFDMWGNTVNVASRMESTGRAGSIQVVEETANILRNFGFEFDQRGLVSVKGKGKLMTFYLTGRWLSTNPPQQHQQQQPASHQHNQLVNAPDKPTLG